MRVRRVRLFIFYAYTPYLFYAIFIEARPEERLTGNGGKSARARAGDRGTSANCRSAQGDATSREE